MTETRERLRREDELLLRRLARLELGQPALTEQARRYLRAGNVTGAQQMARQVARSQALAVRLHRMREYVGDYLAQVDDLGYGMAMQRITLSLTNVLGRVNTAVDAGNMQAAVLDLERGTRLMRLKTTLVEDVVEGEAEAEQEGLDQAADALLAGLQDEEAANVASDMPPVPRTGSAQANGPMGTV